MKNILTFIMAGGKGERLYPLTKDRAKPAVPFGGVYRIIDFALSNCINSGIRKIHILTQYKSISLERHIRRGWMIFESELGEFVDIIPAQQRIDEHWYQGTADSIYQNIYSIEMEKPDYVLILAGDHVYKMNYSKMLDFHVEKKADITLSVVEVPAEKVKEFGIVEVDSSFRVIGFEEKPKVAKTIPNDPKHSYVSMGIYIFSKEFLIKLLSEDAKDLLSKHDFGKNIIPSAIKKGARIFTYNFKDENKKEAQYWRDIGSIDAYFEANMDLISVSPVFNLYDKDWPVRTYQEQFPPAKFVFAQTEEEGGRRGVALDSLISHGSIVSGGKVARTVVSPNVRINSYSIVEDSVIMEGVDVGRYAKIRRAIIDKDVIIPPNTEIGYDAKEDKKRFHVTESGIVVVAKGTEIK